MTPFGVQDVSAGPPLCERSDAGRGQAVDILVRCDPVDDPGGVQMVRQGHLHEDPVDPGICVQPVDDGQKSILVDGARKIQLLMGEADPDRDPLLQPHIDLAGRIIADEDHGEARRTGHPVDPLLELAVEGSGERLFHRAGPCDQSELDEEPLEPELPEPDPDSDFDFDSDFDPAFVPPSELGDFRP